MQLLRTPETAETKGGTSKFDFQSHDLSRVWAQEQKGMWNAWTTQPVDNVVILL